MMHGQKNIKSASMSKFFSLQTVKFEGFELFMVVLMKIQVFVTGWVVHMV
jgi:hypothetical protein